MTLLLLLSSFSLAADPTIVIPGATPAPEVSALVAESHIVEDARDTNSLVGGQNLAIVLWCQPAGDGELAKKISYTAPSFEADSKAFEGSLKPRSDISAVVTMNNPTAGEMTDWLKGQAENLGGDKYREIVVSVACPATGGDTDEERLLTREVTDPNVGGFTFADFAIGIDAIANSTVWLLDASYNLSAATGSPTFGPTADDIAKLGLKDALAISSSAPGKYGDAGLLTSAAAVIARTNGGMIDLTTLYYSGIKPMASTLELGTSLGTPGDGWTNNQQRIILPGGPLIVSVAEAAPAQDSKKPFMFKPSHGVIAAGGGSLAASLVFGLQAKGHYDTLVTYNEVGGESQDELDTAVGAYRTSTGLAIGLGALGIIATAGGITWTVLGSDVTLVPTGTGAAVTGNW